MSQKRQTPDERFLVQLYQTATAAGNPFAEIDSRGVARAVGLKETALKNIVKHLAQANFVKKVDEITLCLTERGCNFVLDTIG